MVSIVAGAMAGSVALGVGELLKQRGADLTIRPSAHASPAIMNGPGEILDVSAAEYAAIFPLR